MNQNWTCGRTGELCSYTRLLVTAALGIGLVVGTPILASPQIVRPSADGTLTDGGVYGAFDGVADNWDWTFNQSSYEGAVTRSTPAEGLSIEQRVVWEFNLASVALQPPVTAALKFNLRGATVYPMPDSVIQIYNYPSDMAETATDFAAGPAVLLGTVTVAAFQPATPFSVDVSAAVGQALTGSRKFAVRFHAAPGAGADSAQAFFDAVDTDVTSKPYLSIDAGSAGVPAASMSSAVSRGSNVGASGGFCDLTLLPPRKSEPRASGIREVRVGFDVAPGTPEGSGITIEQSTCSAQGFVPYTGASAVTSAVLGNDLVLSFDPALENGRTYRLTLGSSITSITGQVIEIRALVGDVNDDGRVNATDRSAVVSAWTGSGFSCLTDINASGATNSTDRSLVVAGWTGTENCAP